MPPPLSITMFGAIVFMSFHSCLVVSNVRFAVHRRLVFKKTFQLIEILRLHQYCVTCAIS